MLVAAPPPLGLVRAVASRRRKRDELDSVWAQQARAQDRMQQVLTSSQKTRQAPPLLHLYSPWWAQEVTFFKHGVNYLNIKATLLPGIGSMPSSQYLSKQALVLKFGARGSQPGFFTWPRGERAVWSVELSLIVLLQVLQWDPTTPWSSLTPPTTESRYLTSMDRTGEMNFS